MKLLLVEDEENLRKPVKYFLERNNFVVDEAEDGVVALEMVGMNEYDCILLDLNLPELDGIEVAKRIREKRNNAPIIMITARSQVYDKLEGFDHGADDYVTKPFDLKELVARINAVIKRSSLNKDDILSFGDSEVLPERNVVKNIKNGKEIILSNKEMGVLVYLLRHQGNFISAEELLEHVWDREIDMFSETVKTHIKTLRQKVDPKKKFIQTVRGKGYCIKC
jgi:DNA-binding response OmpR family regulator